MAASALFATVSSSSSWASNPHPSPSKVYGPVCPLASFSVLFSHFLITFQNIFQFIINWPLEGHLWSANGTYLSLLCNLNHGELIFFFLLKISSFLNLECLTGIQPD